MPATLTDLVVIPPCKLPTFHGHLSYINFDNAATTPPLKTVVDTVGSFLPWYSSVHRGSGYLSRLSTKAYEDSRRIIGEFVGAHPKDHVVIFGKNTTEAINKLSYRLNLTAEDVVLVSHLEHHSNDLPWRAHATVKRIGLTPAGKIDHAAYLALLEKYKGRIKLVAISGASNVTGHLPDIHWFAKMAHSAGSYILIDAAQLAAHRPITMKRLTSDDHIDFLALSGHKIYAPYGSGALIGRRDVFDIGAPEYRGGGTVDIVTQQSVDWTEAPDRDEAGTPHIIGAIAMAKAALSLHRIGFDVIIEHERSLTAYTLERMRSIQGVQIYGDTASDRTGIVSFSIDPIPHQLVASILSYEWGIGVRSGCFCAQPYVAHLLKLNDDQIDQVRSEVQKGHKTSLPGLVRISFGIYNTTTEVDRLIIALTAISKGEYQRYTVNSKTGLYIPIHHVDDFTPYFRL